RVLRCGGGSTPGALTAGRFRSPPPATRLRWSLVPATLGAAALLVTTMGPSMGEAGLEAASAQAATSRRAANAFGTPIPRGVAPAGLPTAQPLPEPRHSAYNRAASSMNALPEWVGPIRGRFLDPSFYSRALRREMPYYLSLPPDYADAGRAYPVLYLLHGASGDFGEWPAIGIVDTLDRAILARDVEPYIVVIPQGDFGYWLN